MFRLLKYSAVTSPQMDGSHIAMVNAAELDGSPMVLYPPQSNMRVIIDDFLRELEVVPRVVMEAADTEVIKCMVEAGFGYSVLHEYALTNSRGFFQTLRVSGHRLVRKQASATSHTGHTRVLTAAVMSFLKDTLDQPMHPAGATGLRRLPGTRRPQPARGRSRSWRFPMPGKLPPPPAPRYCRISASACAA